MTTPEQKARPRPGAMGPNGWREMLHEPVDGAHMDGLCLEHLIDAQRGRAAPDRPGRAKAHDRD